MQETSVICWYFKNCFLHWPVAVCRRKCAHCPRRDFVLRRRRGTVSDTSSIYPSVFLVQIRPGLCRSRSDRESKCIGVIFAIPGLLWWSVEAPCHFICLDLVSVFLCGERWWPTKSFPCWCQSKYNRPFSIIEHSSFALPDLVLLVKTWEWQGLSPQDLGPAFVKHWSCPTSPASDEPTNSPRTLDSDLKSKQVENANRVMRDQQKLRENFTVAKRKTGRGKLIWPKDMFAAFLKCSSMSTQAGNSVCPCDKSPRSLEVIHSLQRNFLQTRWFHFLKQVAQFCKPTCRFPILAESKMYTLFSNWRKEIKKGFLLPIIQVEVQQLWLVVLNAVIDQVTVKLHEAHTVRFWPQFQQVRMTHDTLNAAQTRQQRREICQLRRTEHPPTEIRKKNSLEHRSLFFEFSCNWWNSGCWLPFLHWTSKAVNKSSKTGNLPGQQTKEFIFHSISSLIDVLYKRWIQRQVERPTSLTRACLCWVLHVYPLSQMFDVLMTGQVTPQSGSLNVFSFASTQIWNTPWSWSPLQVCVEFCGSQSWPVRYWPKDFGKITFPVQHPLQQHSLPSLLIPIPDPVQKHMTVGRRLWVAYVNPGDVFAFTEQVSCPTLVQAGQVNDAFVPPAKKECTANPSQFKTNPCLIKFYPSSLNTIQNCQIWNNICR